MSKPVPALLALLLLLPAVLSAQTIAPSIGYVFPAGGTQGDTLKVTIGGQLLKGSNKIHISGSGVHGRVLGDYKPLIGLNKEQRAEIMHRIKNRYFELAGSDHTPPFYMELFFKKMKRKKWRMFKSVDLPDHPLVNDLATASIEELEHLVYTFIKAKDKRQLNAQIAFTTEVEIAIDTSAPPGIRELRLETQLGLSNPLRFEVSALPEVKELEPNDPLPEELAPKNMPLVLPVIVNGQIMPGDVDRYAFRANRGQQIVVQAKARELIPFLADAVPGWFQATLAVFDSDGKELAFVDDHSFNPDPLLVFKAPYSGMYEVEIRDSIFRGREDFVYRLRVSDDAEGVKPPYTAARIYSNARRRSSEREPNNSIKYARGVRLPLSADGVISKPGDIDVFSFRGHAGDEVVAEITARELRSPLDSLLKLTDGRGAVIAWNDDFEIKQGHLRTAMGELTHHADSYLKASLPRDGVYYVHVSDAQGAGSKQHQYRLRISAPNPDFALYASPSSISLRAGRSAPVDLYLIRKDGFDGEVRISLANAPNGFSIDGGRIPAGQDHIRMTVNAPRKAIREPLKLQFTGSAPIEHRTVRRDAVPAENMMQAFLWRHLVPAEQMWALVQEPKWKSRPIERANKETVRLPRGGTASIKINSARIPKRIGLEFELSEAPEGVRLKTVEYLRDGLRFVVESDSSATKPGVEGNLIVAVYKAAGEGRVNKKGKKRQGIRRYLGVLPAIPFEVVEQKYSWRFK